MLSSSRRNKSANKTTTIGNNLSRGGISSKKKQQVWVKRITCLLFITLAWTWILAIFAVLFHSQNNRPQKGGNSTPIHHVSTTINPPPSSSSNMNDNKILKPSSDADQIHLSSEQLEQEYKHKAYRNHVSLPKFMSPMVIFTCKRANYLEKTLETVFQTLPKHNCEIGCPLIISQDGTDPDVANVVVKYQQRYGSIVPIVHWQHNKNDGNNGNDEETITHRHHQQSNKKINPYQALAQHYGWALYKIFDGNMMDQRFPAPERLILLEEDLLIAPDFFDYFKHLAPLLDESDNGENSNLLAISAFHDNGQQGRVSDPLRVKRSDFFPGLGWMMTRQLWEEELSVKWPQGYWDDWLREPQQRQGRHILYPEVSRTFHFGTKGGASNNQFGGSLSSVMLNSEPVDWDTYDPTQLQESVYDTEYYRLIISSKLASSLPEAMELAQTSSNVRLEYTSFREFQKYAGALKLMTDEKAGIPRSSYRGVVETRPHGTHFLFLTPPSQQLKQQFQHKKGVETGRG